MGNLSALSTLSTAVTALSNLILATPQTEAGYQPQNAPDSDGNPSQEQQPDALLFHYEGEQTATFESDITDHYVEDNTAIQDQIALRPETITTHGFIGELNDIAPPGLALLKTAANKLTTLNAYAPALSTTALIAYNTAFQTYQLAQVAKDAAVAAVSSLTGSGEAQNKQQVMFQQFYGYWKKRTLFTVQTPWAVFPNMAIKNLRAIQDSETRMITDFEVTFKMIRTASTQTNLGLPLFYEGRLQMQGASLLSKGTQKPRYTLGLNTALGGGS